MATDFNKNAIMSKGGFVPSTTDTPIDIRSRINTISDVSSIPSPYIGMIFYVIDEDKYYKVQSLKDDTSGIIVKINASIDQYDELISQDLSGIENKLSDLEQSIEQLHEDSDTEGSIRYYIEQSYVWNNVN